MSLKLTSNIYFLQKEAIRMDRIEWYGQGKQVVLHIYEGQTTVESFMDIAYQSYKLLNTVDHPVQIIVNRVQALFPKFQPFELKSLEAIVPDNQDLVIVVGAHYNVEALSNIVGLRIAPKAFESSYYVATMNDAHKILQRERGINLE